MHVKVNYEKEIKVIKEVNEQKDVKKEQAVEEHVEEIRKIEEEHDIKVEELEIEKQKELAETIEKNKEIVTAMTRSDEFEKKDYLEDKGLVQVIFNDGLIYLSLKGIINFKEEKKRLQKNLKKIETEIKKIEIKLNDNNFIDNAPENIIKEQKEREKEYQLSKNKILRTIQSFK